MAWALEGRIHDPEVLAEVKIVAKAPIAELRRRYTALFRTDPPKAFGPDLLRRSIAFRIQERAYGGLPRETQRILDRLVKQYLANPTGRLTMPRRIKPGSVLVRTWNKKTYQVMVQDQGFAFKGKTYSNLSEIAFAITGTRWNGPRFFGLRTKETEDQDAPDFRHGR